MPVLATALSGVLYGLAFPPVGVRLIAWIALVPFLVAVRRVGARGVLGLGWLWTVVASAMTTGWFPRAVVVYYAQPLVVGLGLFVLVTTFTAAVQYTAFAACYRHLARRPGAFVPLLAGAAWAAAEYARVEFPVGDPWALSGYSQSGVVPLVQIADVTGVYGIAFVLATVNAALAEAWLFLRGRSERRAALGSVAVAVACVGLVLGYGAFRLAGRPALASRPATPVTVVQANLDLGSQWRSEFYGQNLEAYLRLSSRALEERPTLVLWPESSMTFFLDSEPLYRGSIARVLAASGAQLLAGGPRMVGRDGSARYYNSAFLVASDGTIVSAYDKRRLLPFAEYFPVWVLDLVRRRFGRVREFTPGAATPPLPTAAGAAGIVICNEAMFPGIAADRVRHGAEYLVNLSNDSWVGDEQFSAIAFATASMRAVEQRRWLIRASTSGPSAVVDPFGEVIARSPIGAPAVIAGRVRALDGLTPYARLGDSFALACAGLVAAAVVRRA